MKTILLATDFSGAAQNAANYAADMALVINADLLLVHIYEIPVSYGEMPVPVNDEVIMENAEKNITELKEQLSRKTGGKLHIATEVTTGVFFFHELKSVCERIKPYAVVMGSHGTTAAERLFFGSQTVYAMKYLVWPLVSVPPEAAFSAVKKIGLACDFENVLNTTLLDEIKMLVSDFNAELHVINTGKEQVPDPDVAFELGLLDDMLNPLKPDYHFITSENTDEGIMNFAEENDIDLLVVLPKRHGLLHKLIHKSHTKQMVLYSHVPVMALHQ